jgi:predicted metalloprotease with PDZ domain
MLLARAELMEPARIVENVVAFARHHTARPAYHHTALADSSLATFLNHTRWAGAWNATLDYYDGGMLVAFELDALLRVRHGSSLDELFVAFYAAYEGKAGFDTAAFEAFAEARHPGLGDWIARKVRQPGTLDVAGALQSLGLEVERKPRARLGVVFEKGSLVAGQVLEGGAAYDAGLAPGDEILAIDGFRATAKALAWSCERAQPFRATVRRGHRHREIDLRARYVDEVTGLRVGPSFGAAARALLGPKANDWVEGHRISIAHYDNFHGTEPIH